MNERQLALAASSIGVSRPTLVAFAEGRSSLPARSLHQLGVHIFCGRFFIKREERA